MTKTLQVMVRELRTTLGRKSFTIIGFGVPLVLAIIAAILIIANKDKPLMENAASIFMPSTHQPAEGYVDEAGLITFVPDNAPQGWLTRFPDEASADKAMEAGKIEGYYIIAPGYLSSGELIYVKPEFSIIRDRPETTTMQWILLANLMGDAELANEAMHPFETKATSLTAADAMETGDSWIDEMFPTIMTLMIYMAIVLSSSVLVTAVTDEKKNRVMEVLLSSVSPGQLITGKLLALGVLGLLLLLAWLGVFLFVALFGGSALNIPISFEIPYDVLAWSVIFGLLGYAIYGALMAGLGALAPDVKDTRSASFVVLAPLILAYMLLIFIATEPDGVLSILLSLFPLTSPVTMISRMTSTTVPFWQAALAAALQLITALLIVRTVVRLFRAQTLLSGQPFDTKRYLTALVGRS